MACPFQPGSKNTLKVTPGIEKFLCRKCSGDGDGGDMDAETFKRHAKYLGILEQSQPSLCWQVRGPDGRLYEHVRIDKAEGSKAVIWRPNLKPNGIKLADMSLYGVERIAPGSPVVVVTEGEKAADAAGRLGLAAVGTATGAACTPSDKPLLKLLAAKPGRVVLWPDMDPEGAKHMRNIGRKLAKLDGCPDVLVVDPAQLGLTGKGYDAADWRPAAGVDVLKAVLHASAPPQPPKATREPKADGSRPPGRTAAPVATPDADGDAAELAAVRALSDVVPLEFRELCISEKSIAALVAKFAGRRLRYVRDEGSWFKFSGEGWQPVKIDTLRTSIMWCGEANYGKEAKVEGDTTIVPDPKAGGRKSTAAGGIAGLQGFVGSDTADWDREGHIAGLPGGKALNLKTGEVFDVTRDDLIRRRLAAAPCSREEYERSKWREVVEHVIPDDQEREWLQRRLGAALMDAPASDDLICLFGAAGSGKGLFLEGVIAAFGDYAVNIPQQELTAGGTRGHAQWKHRMIGRRLLTLDEIPARSLDAEATKGLIATRITANAMRQGSIDFILRAPILTTSNDAPTVRAADPGLERRLKPIECGEPIPVEKPQWTGQIRPFVDTANPAISGAPRRELISTSGRRSSARLSGPWCASFAVRT